MALVPEPDFQTIFDSLPGIYLVLKPDFTMVAANQARYKATLSTPEGTLGRNLFDLFPDNPNDPAATGVANLKASLKRVLQTKKPDTMAVQKYDIPRPESEGGGFEERYWSPMNSPVLNAKGEVAYIVHRVEDVTEFVRLKQKGAEQGKLAEELQDKVRATEMEVFLRAQELQAANEKLWELDKLKTEFFANVSHELRTPLTLILAPIESLLADKPAGDPALVPRPVLQTVHNNAVRLLTMINGLLDFSKVSAGKTEVKREPVNILDLARSIFWDFKGVMEHKGIEGNLRAEAVSPVVEMDRYLFERILFNLLSNAVKFTPKGGKVAVALEAADEKLKLSVTDTGIGISQKDQERLFEKFYQAEGSSARRFEGTGLGLALVKEFSHLLGGDVAVKSEPGKGSTFTLTCSAPPALGPPTEGRASSGLKPQIEGQGLAAPVPDGNQGAETESGLPKILVAEDNRELSAFLASLLSPLGQVLTADDGAEALELARSRRPDLVLSDVMMPRLDGIQLTKELKTNPETADIPVVLLTAMTNRESLLKGWEAGADDYLFKPFHPKELEARVRGILSGLEWRRKGEAYKRQRDALESFTYIASHDLREPLRKIISYVDLFLSEFPGFLGEPRQYLSAVSRSAERMMRLLDALIQYTRVEHPQGPWENTPLERVAREALEKLDLERLGAEVALGPLPSLPVQPDLLGVVFSNLIGNAVKFRQEGRPPRVRVEAAQRGAEWVVSVSDNGIGFDPAKADRIFLMFERLHSHDAIAGEGMGLAICRRIIENHGGRIWAESEPGQGSTFYFTLPAERKPVRNGA